MRGRHHPRMQQMEATARLHANGGKRSKATSAPSAEWLALQAISAELRQSRRGGSESAEVRERYDVAFKAWAATGK